MVSKPAKWGSMAAVMFGCLALALVAIAAQVTPPNLGSSDTKQGPVVLTPADLDQFVGFYVRGANIVFSITRDAAHDGARLLIQVPGFDPVGFVADSQMNFVCVAGGFKGNFVRDAQGQTTSLVLHFGTAFSVPMLRIDASAAQTIMASNDIKARSQTPVPGSEAALRRLINGVRARKPNYEEMASWYAELVRQVTVTTSLNDAYGRWGEVQSITFSHVDLNGGDVYDVRRVASRGGLFGWTRTASFKTQIMSAVDATGSARFEPRL